MRFARDALTLHPFMDTLTKPPAKTRELKMILLLCLVASVRVFIFSAAFPFFNPVDEQRHFDLAVKYSQGHVPRAGTGFGGSDALCCNLRHARISLGLE